MTVPGSLGGKAPRAQDYLLRRVAALEKRLNQRLRLTSTIITNLGSTVAAFSSTGVLTVKPGSTSWYVEKNTTITLVRASVGTAPVGADVVVDVNRNGTTVFTTQSTRPRIVDGTRTATSTPQVLSLSAGDYLTVDIDQVGAATAGSDLTVQIGLV